MTEVPANGMVEIDGWTCELSSRSDSGFKFVTFDPASKKYAAKMVLERGGRQRTIGLFVTAKEAAIAIAKYRAGVLEAPSPKAARPKGAKRQRCVRTCPLLFPRARVLVRVGLRDRPACVCA